MITDTEQEVARYHFVLTDLVEYIELYGWDTVVDDLKNYYHIQMFNRMHESEF
jgi:hypothetical protein